MNNKNNTYDNSNEQRFHHSVVFYLYLIFFCLLAANFILWYIYFFAPQIDLLNALRLFDFDNEKNVPTLFNVFLLLINAYIFYAIFAFEKKRKDTHYNKWLLLSFLLFLMASDEYFMLHEKLVNPVKNYLGTSGIFYFAWVIPMSLVVLIVLIYFFRFFLSLPKKIKTGVATAVVIYLSGAIGFEMIGGWWLTNFGDGFGYKMITTIEESFEMIGLIYLIKTLFLYEDQDKNRQQLM